jgi:hypothetical protein
MNGGVIAHNPNAANHAASIRPSPLSSRFVVAMRLCIALLVIGGAAPWSFAQSSTEDDQTLLAGFVLPPPAPPAPAAPRNTGAGAQDEGLGNFRHISITKAPTKPLSLVDVAPGLLPFFNNAPVFGLPGTVEGNFWHRTQLLGDLNGHRTDLADRGIFIDMYSTTAYQNVTSGGIKTGNAYAQNTQLSINVDTAKAGLWPGGLFHFTVQSRYGSSPQNSFTVGSFVPQYTGFVVPGPTLWQETEPSEYLLTQASTKKLSTVLGVISDIFVPDETLFGNSHKYYFANFNLNKNPMTTNTYHPTSIAALGAWTAKEWLLIAGGVLDPFTRANTLEDALG